MQIKLARRVSIKTKHIARDAYNLKALRFQESEQFNKKLLQNR